MKDEEHYIQAALMLRVLLELVPFHPEAALLYAIPNGGYRPGAGGARMKEEGVKAGVPDLFLPVARNGAFGMYIEMKAPTGTVQASQRTWLVDLRAQGYLAYVCHSDDEAMKILTEYLGYLPTRRGQVLGQGSTELER